MLIQSLFGQYFSDSSLNRKTDKDHGQAGFSSSELTFSSQHNETGTLTNQKKFIRVPFIRVKKWRLWTVLKKQNINALATKYITLTFTRFYPTAKYIRNK